MLKNAVKFTPEEGRIWLTAEEQGDQVVISVRDTGYGIPVGKRERLFTPFDRLGAEQSGVEGTGLGLALSKGLIEAMGGRVGVETTVDEGSEFWVELPLTFIPETIQEAPPPVSQLEAPSPTTEAAHTVLFVEDNLANVRLMERVFQRRPQREIQHGHRQHRGALRPPQRVGPRGPGHPAAGRRELAALEGQREGRAERDFGKLARAPIRTGPPAGHGGLQAGRPRADRLGAH